MTRVRPSGSASGSPGSPGNPGTPGLPGAPGIDPSAAFGAAPVGEPGSDLAVELTGPADDVTGLPGLNTWGRVYLLVTVVFVIYVVALAAFARVFA